MHTHCTRTLPPSGRVAAHCALTSPPSSPPLLPPVQPEQIRQCLVDYASINVWQLSGAESEAPSIVLAVA